MAKVNKENLQKIASDKGFNVKFEGEEKAIFKRKDKPKSEPRTEPKPDPMMMEMAKLINQNNQLIAELVAQGKTEIINASDIPVSPDWKVEVERGKDGFIESFTMTKVYN